MTKTAGILLFFLTMGFSGCALLGDKTPLASDTQGRIENKVYMSPSGSFQLRLPDLATDGAKIRDEIPTSGTLLLSISDDLCREFIVSERPGNPGTQPLESWVKENIVEQLKESGIKLEEPAVRQMSQGSAISFRYRQQNAAPCVQTTKKDGKVIELKPDADVAWYVFYHSGFFYRLIYVLGVGSGLKDAWFVKKAPADEVLARFAEGFQIMAAKDK